MTRARKPAADLVFAEEGPDGPPKMVTVTVAEHTQVNHEGTVYGEGETVDLPEAEAKPLLDAGIVTASGSPG